MGRGAGQRLIEAIKAAPGVRRLAGNPLLLTIVVLVHRLGRLPRHRIALYAECARTLNERWNQVRSMAMQPVVGLPMDATEAFRNFGPWRCGCTKRSDAAPSAARNWRGNSENCWLTGDCRRKTPTWPPALSRNGAEPGRIASGTGVNAYGFSHLTFQEYFAARPSPPAGKDYRQTAGAPARPALAEVILLTAGQIGVRKPRKKQSPRWCRPLPAATARWKTSCTVTCCWPAAAWPTTWDRLSAARRTPGPAAGPVARGHF